MRWRTVSCKVLVKTQDYFEEPGAEETDRTQSLCPFKDAHLLSAWPAGFSGVGTHKTSCASLPSHPFSSPALSEPPWQGTHKRKEFVPIAAEVQGQPDPNQTRRPCVCFLLCFALWKTRCTFTQSQQEVDPGRCLTPEWSAPEGVGFRINRYDVRYAVVIINQLQLLFRYIRVSFGHQHQKHERTPLAQSALFYCYGLNKA